MFSPSKTIIHSYPEKGDMNTFKQSVYAHKWMTEGT